MLRKMPIWTVLNRLPCRSSLLATARRLLTTETTTTSQASTPPPSSPKSSLAARKTQMQLSYLVERTPSKNLSVYNDARAGGTKKQTVVKKIVGDARALRDEIVEELHFPKDHVKISPVTGHIKIKGFHAEKVQKWLESRGL